MHLTALTLHHFRNYTRATIPFAPGMNVIQGNNGAGKTNLLEAIYLLTTGRSFRTAHLADLIQKGYDSFYLEAHFKREGVAQSLGFGFDKTKRTIYHNSSKQRGSSDLLGLFPSVLYAPKDSALIAGAPADRRRFLNIQLAQMQPVYAYHLVRYHKARGQRNVLLKRHDTETICSWEQVMAESGHYLIEKRSQLITALRPKVADYIAALSPTDAPFNLHYQPSIPLKENESQARGQQLMMRFQQERAKELLFGATLSGPHRDDLLISYCDREAKVYASEGQKKTCVAALKMAEWDHLASQIGCQPLFTIDDFGTHLDALRIERLERQLTHFGQILVTTPHSPFPNASQLTICDGQLTDQAV
ncbi:MAG: DNA replication/repair protein RecF [Chlamydiota bacterium]